MSIQAVKTKIPAVRQGRLCPGGTVSRILCAPFLRPARDDHLSWRGIAAPLMRATSRPRVAPRTLALAPERVCREPALPPAETRSRWIAPPTPRHFSPFTRLRGSVLSLWHFPWVYGGTSGTCPFLHSAISRPPLAALHESHVTARNGVRTFLTQAPCGVPGAIICPARAHGR
jgi:hypothetical protein